MSNTLRQYFVQENVIEEKDKEAKIDELCSYVPDFLRAGHNFKTKEDVAEFAISVAGLLKKSE